MSLSTQLEALAAKLREGAGNVTPATWQWLRPIANEAEELAEEAARVENLEAAFIDGAREAGHGRQALQAAG